MERSNAHAVIREVQYKNPVYPYYFADPFVWKFDGKYYAVGTGPIAEQEASGEGDFTTYNIGGKEMAIPLLVSNDLVNWKLHGGAYEVPESAKGSVFWAPEVAYHDGTFYLYFSCAKEDLKHQLRVASSRSPTGPFIDAGPLLPPSDNCSFAIDAHAFQDDDGQWYLFYARDFLDVGEKIRAGTALVVDRLANMTRLAGKPETVLRAKCDWQLFAAKRPIYGQIFDWHTLEGPCVRKRQGRYYCFYSGGCYQGDGYGVDYGISDHVLGPYTDEGNDTGARVLKTVPGQIIGPGHHSIVEGPNGKTDFMVYHAWDPQMTARRMFIDPLEWTEAGPRCHGPTITPQFIKGQEGT